MRAALAARCTSHIGRVRANDLQAQRRLAVFAATTLILPWHRTLPRSCLNEFADEPTYAAPIDELTYAAPIEPLIARPVPCRPLPCLSRLTAIILLVLCLLLLLLAVAICLAFVILFAISFVTILPWLTSIVGFVLATPVERMVRAVMTVDVHDTV